MKKILLSIFLTFFCGLVFAAASPVDMLQNLSDQMLGELQKNEAVLKTKPDVVHGIVQRLLVPRFDITTMSHMAVGRAWDQATPTQRQRFTQEFTTLLVRTYSAAFAQYTNETVKFLPTRGDISNQTRVQVSSQIIRPGGPPISVNYLLVQQNNQWLIYDFSVDGISMIQSYRSQFAQDLNQGGMDALIQKLTQHNVQLQSQTHNVKNGQRTI